MTFLVSGIWHGANWAFIVWGIWHGIAQIIEKAIGQQKCEYGWIGKTIKIVITFLLVNFAWIFFRMPTLSDACGVIQRIFDLSLPMKLFVSPLPHPPFMLWGILMLFAKDLTDEFFPDRIKLFNNDNRYVRWFSYVIMIIIIMMAGVFGSDQFIYANF